MKPRSSDTDPSEQDPSSAEAAKDVSTDPPEVVRLQASKPAVRLEKPGPKLTVVSKQEAAPAAKEHPVLLRKETEEGPRKQPSGKSVDESVDEDGMPIGAKPIEPWEIESQEWGKERQFDWKWAVGAVLVVVLVLVVGLAVLPWINQQNEVTEQEIGRWATDDPTGLSRQRSTEVLLNEQQEARNMFRKYLAATVPEDYLLTLRNPAVIEPLVRGFHGKPQIGGSWDGADKDPWVVRFVDGRPFGCLKGQLPDLSSYEAYFVLQDDRMLMDWKATVAYSTASFDDLVRGEGDAAEIRGVILPGLFYTDVFGEKEFQSYQLLSPNQEQVVWCYVPRQSEIQERLRKMFLGGEVLKQQVAPLKVTVRLKRPPEGARANQWVIDALLQKEWLEP